MDAERIAGYQVAGRHGADGRQMTTGSQPTTEHHEAGSWERAAFGAVPNQRGEPGQPGRPATVVGAGGADDADAASNDVAEVDRIDVRCEPLMVRDGCSPDRIPAGRWPSDGSLVRSEQFAVNEAIAQPGLF